LNPDVCAAAALDIERRGSEETNSHLEYAQDYDTPACRPRLHVVSLFQQRRSH